MKKRLKAIKESQRLYQATLKILRVRGLQAFSMTTNKTGLREGIILDTACDEPGAILEAQT